MPYWAWSLLALLLFLPALAGVQAWLVVRGLRFRRGSIVEVGEGEVPDWEREVLRGADGVLSAQGFRFEGYTRLEDILAGEPSTRHEAVFRHGGLPVRAIVSLAGAPVPQCPFSIGYLSCFKNGRMLSTQNLEPALAQGTVPWLIENALLLDSWDAVWESHRARHAALAAEAEAEDMPLPALDFLRDKAGADLLPALRERGQLVPAEDGLERLGAAGCWRMAAGLASWSRRLARAQRAWQGRKETYPLPPRAEAQGYLRARRHAPRAGSGGKGLLVLAGLLAFALLYGQAFSPAFAAALLLVVAAHEAGHALAMMALGYRDVSVFFIPFFGGLATGSPREPVHPWKEALILLAGPVPGMAAGAAILSFSAAGAPAFVPMLGALALIVNGFNLLPIAPLDGGKLLHLILFRRSPALGRIFMILSGAALLLAAAAGKDLILGGVGAAVILASGRAYRQAKVLSELRLEREREAAAGAPAVSAYESDAPAFLGPAPTPRPDPYSAEAVADLFRRLGREPQPFRQKAEQVRSMLPETQTRVPGFGSAVAILAAYVAAWLIPLALFLSVLPAGHGPAEAARSAKVASSR